MGSWTARRLLRLKRDAVRGDLAELGVSGGRALWDVIGLVVRRQGRLWVDWRPWLAVVGVVAPLGMLPSHRLPVLGGCQRPHVFLYADNWTWAFLTIPLARHDLVEIGTRLFLNDLTLIGWSWTCGFAPGSFSSAAPGRFSRGRRNGDTDLVGGQRPGVSGGLWSELRPAAPALDSATAYGRCSVAATAATACDGLAVGDMVARASCQRWRNRTIAG